MSDETLKKLKIMWAKSHIKLYRHFLKLIGYTRDSTSRNLFRLFQIAFYCLLIISIINFLAIIFGKVSYGELGDFFGGLLNPILTFLTFMGLLLTIVLQNKELRETRLELKRSSDALIKQNESTKIQSFEQTLFNMLGLHEQIVNSIDLYNKDTKNTTTGRDCFSVFYSRFKTAADNNRISIIHTYHSAENELEKINKAWDSFWVENQSELGHYFRYIYNIIKFIHEHDFDRTRYIRIVRAQLSDQELLVLFYNCLSKNGIEKFKPLVEEYTLFDNIPTSKLIRNQHIAFYEKSAYEKKETST